LVGSGSGQNRTPQTFAAEAIARRARVELGGGKTSIHQQRRAGKIIRVEVTKLGCVPNRSQERQSVKDRLQAKKVSGTGGKKRRLASRARRRTGAEDISSEVVAVICGLPLVRRTKMASRKVGQNSLNVTVLAHLSRSDLSVSR
jgi:hypothetical protein